MMMGLCGTPQIYDVFPIMSNPKTHMPAKNDPTADLRLVLRDFIWRGDLDQNLIYMMQMMWFYALPVVPIKKPDEGNTRSPNFFVSAEPCGI
jgi:hypothetical protein